jgi:two-component system cell cycle sensor histidine kinase/response regulator CckA
MKLLGNTATWVVLLISITLLSIVWLGYTTLRNTGLFVTSEKQLVETLTTQQLVKSIASDHRDAENDRRDYFLTDDDGVLRDFYDSLGTAESAMADLRKRIPANPIEAADFEQFLTLVSARLQTLQQAAEAQVVEEQDLRSSIAEMRREERLAGNPIRMLASQLDGSQEMQLDRLKTQFQERGEWTKLEILGGHILASGLLAVAGLTIYVDRRKRMRIEQDLLATSQRMSGIIESAITGIVCIDQRQRIVLVNATAEKIFRCSQQAALGRSIGEFIPQRDRTRYKKALSDFMESSEQQMLMDETRALRDDDEEFPVALSLSKSGHGDQKLVTFMVNDLSEQHAREAKMREQSAILNQIRDAVQIRDNEDRITYWNHGSETLYGWSHDEVIGKQASALMAPQRLPEHAELTSSINAYGSWIGELKQLTKSGREILVEQRRTLLHDAAGEASGQLIIALDVSERQKQAISERRRQRLESLGTLAGGIAHDLNNVLTPITMASSLLEQEQPPVTRQRLSQTIRASAERGAEMIRQLLAFAGGGKQNERSTLSVAGVIEEVRGLLQHTLPKNIRLRAQVDPALASIRGDATELTQVLINLAVNARDAMPNGGELTILAENLELDKPTTMGTRTLQPGDYVKISICDSGQGIESEIAEHVFDPFFTTKEQGKGTGLGLATCLGIVHSHGGSIGVASELGEGATFTIMLPSDRAGPIDLPSVPSADAPKGQGQCVLVVDDENLICSMAREVLENHGYQVLTAENGADGLAICMSKGEQISVIVMDMMMPGMDGPATIAALQSRGIKTPIIACSGIRNAAHSSIVGVTAFLGKPYSNQQLLRVVHDALRPTKL